MAIYLASRSPRRQELLRQIGVDFDLLLLRSAAGRHRDVVEEARDGEPPLHYVERIARTKASVGWRRMQERGLSPRPVLGADTEVVLDGAIFGKPADVDAARKMIARLAGRRHEVITAVAVRMDDDVEVAVSVSQVTMRRLSAGQIERYVASGEAHDKAGAYAVQGRAAAFITRLEGSYSGVMGLPLAETAALLARFGRAVL
ncbi:MAG: septum formation inhibitor Maf [Burkholderiales bacterium]|nr:septum formation inhibitor Maf [Burkholderiales bacterium]